MHVLRDTDSIDAAIRSSPDPHIARLLTRAVQFLREYEDEYEVGDLLNVIMVEPGDTLQAIDDEMGQSFLTNHYGGKRFGEPGFVPCFETLEEHATFYDMVFIQSDEGFAVQLLIPKCPGIEPWLLALCAQHSKPFQETPQ